MDFIITWVDGNDPKWQEEFNQFKSIKKGEKSAARFRDWENLQYLFRGIEKFTPWVNKIHFVTWGHLPNWLNTEHPKLNIVSHRDFIPKDYLPTFNSHTIEFNFHRIQGLANEYVYFNDDFFILNHLKPDHFFKKGKPCDMAVCTTIRATHPFHSILFNNLFILNRHFRKKKNKMMERPSLWFNRNYGISNSLRNYLFGYLDHFFHTGFVYFHLPQAYLKSTLSLLWEKEYEALDKTCQQTFRDFSQINNYLLRDWELASNNFYPINREKLGKKFEFRDNIPEQAMTFIREQKRPLVCLNDYKSFSADRFELAKEEIKVAFEAILPHKSAFEI